MKAVKSFQWLYAGDKKHWFTNIADLDKATSFLAQQEDAWNQSWHLPTDSVYLSGQKITETLNRKLGKNLKLQVLPAFAVSFLGLFKAPLHEIKKLHY